MGNWYDIGQTHYATLNGAPYERIYTFPQFPQIAVGYRMAKPDRLTPRIGEVIRGVDYKGYFVNMRGDIGSSTDVVIAPGAMAQRVAVNVPRPGGLAGDNVRDPFAVYIAPSPVPIGLLLPGADDPNSTHWGGMGTSGIVCLDSFPPASADVVAGTAKLYTSGKPGWTVLVPDALTVGQVDRMLALRVAYGDDEVVPGLRVRLDCQTLATEIQFSTGWAVSGVAITDSVGRIDLPIRAVTGEASAVRIRVDDPRCSPEYFNPFFDQIYPVNTVAQTIGGRQCVTLPPVPAVRRIPPYFLRTPDYSWNAAADSILQIDGDVEMTVDGMGLVIGVIIGFTTTREQVDPARIEHGFYFHTNARGNRVVDVYETGQTKGVQEVGYTEDNVFRITRANGVVSYWIGDVKIYTSTRPSTGTLTVGEHTYATGDSV